MTKSHVPKINRVNNISRRRSFFIHYGIEYIKFEEFSRTIPFPTNISFFFIIILLTLKDNLIRPLPIIQTDIKLYHILKT